ncbi:dihydroxyacetone synthase [Yamadazyma tenuis]|uniref:transketolase n=1 Tax=Candida tenuis (strain ATCC 10573 / BCRC 21748 / CBS 615 / JCM 9827 / NBRC 10315 / NRRL Y-1498 / VKM Y-70) TaxID=590646 RepID=G3B8B6_CANTC|nr:dihydroxyacetone synthase [Yamadazyma tenuis ATCC 10573]EGV61733.1 dihydroxyacetone synthase [Yamadazyma tenuis ATCC 10573]WEJ92963.1 dihydroxyacetone synthase [Yamadazyma tenuis]
MTVPESLQNRSQTHQYVLKIFRVLIADLVQQFNGGHPGGAMDMAAIGIALFKYVMKYSPSNPDYFNRDRFVLSNGHTCLFQYAFQHLVGYSHMTMEQLKTYHSSELESYCPGHPENEFPGIEVTTGALGQGISNSVGLAIASKNLSATYNRPGFEVSSGHIFCMVGDACLQEGVSLEAISLAGHLGLNNLTVIYDNNQITCDGSVDLTNTENIKKKFEACNWQVLEVQDGSNDVDGIIEALETAKKSEGNPTLIIAYTQIGIDTSVEGQAVAHGAAFGQSEVDNLHTLYGFDPETKFFVPETVYQFFADVVPRGKQLEKQWTELVHDYSLQYPELALEFENRRLGKLPPNWQSFIPNSFPTTPTPSRKSSGLVFNEVAKNVNNFIVGTADLSPSVNLIWKGKTDFQNPRVKTSCGINGDYSGRYIHYGVREHAMAAISNGIAAYSPKTFIPVTSSFFMFYLYAAPAVRYGALSQLQVIHVATHDSIGIGEDGPTHHPIALASLYRSMPNMLYIRPCDSTEVAGAWEHAIEADNTPTIISLSRHNLEQYPQYSRKDKVRLGAYKFIENAGAVINIISTGSEMQFAVEASQVLAQKGIIANVISFPCQRLFEKQPLEYKRSILNRGKVPSVVVEAYAVNGWERYATAGINMSTFGKSLPGKMAYEYFGFNSERIAAKIEKYYEDWKQDESLRFEFQDLN